MRPLNSDAMTTVDILFIVREPVWFTQCETPIPAGFPSPAEDEAGELVDLNKILLPHPGTRSSSACLPPMALSGRNGSCKSSTH